MTRADAEAAYISACIACDAAVETRMAADVALNDAKHAVTVWETLLEANEWEDAR